MVRPRGGLNSGVDSPCAARLASSSARSPPSMSSCPGTQWRWIRRERRDERSRGERSVEHLEEVLCRLCAVGERIAEMAG